MIYSHCEIWFDAIYNSYSQNQFCLKKLQMYAWSSSPFSIFILFILMLDRGPGKELLKESEKEKKKKRRKTETGWDDDYHVDDDDQMTGRMVKNSNYSQRSVMKTGLK